MLPGRIFAPTQRRPVFLIGHEAIIRSPKGVKLAIVNAALSLMIQRRALALPTTVLTPSFFSHQTSA